MVPAGIRLQAALGNVRHHQGALFLSQRRAVRSHVRPAVKLFAGKPSHRPACAPPLRFHAVDPVCQAQAMQAPVQTGSHAFGEKD